MVAGGRESSRDLLEGGILVLVYGIERKCCYGGYATP